MFCGAKATFANITRIRLRGQAAGKPAPRKETAMTPYTGLSAYAGSSGSPVPSRPLEDLIAVARKQRPAELVIKNARVFNAFSGEFTSGDVAVRGGYIAGIGQYEGARKWDVAGAYLTPGFIDAHVHLESAMASPTEYAKVVVPHGTSAVVIDPHEIANVAGADGLAYILEATENLPLTVYVMLPSCVPASPLEWGGARLTAAVPCGTTTLANSTGEAMALSRCTWPSIKPGAR